MSAPRRPLDWQAWHASYDEPDSRLARRLVVVQRRLREAIEHHAGPIRVISMCAGQGRDVIGVLAEHPRRNEITATLVELEPANAASATRAAAGAGLDRVEVRVADAAMSESYVGAAPAEIVLACGVFGNIPDDEVRSTIAWLPALCSPGATVLWTRGAERDRDTRAMVRRWFAESGFEEVAYDGPPETYGVGAVRLAAKPTGLLAGRRLFRFTR